MLSLISEVLNYILILLIFVYAALGFLSFMKKEEKKLLFAMQFLLLFFHFLGFLNLYLHGREGKLILLYVLQLLFFVFFYYLYRLFYSNFSKTLFFHMMFLMLTGLLFLTRLNIKAGIRQSIFVAIGLASSLFLPFLIKKVGFLRKMGLLYGLFGISTLLYVFLKATRIYGAKNWITLFGFRFQPSEFVKIVLIFMIASFLFVEKNLKQLIIVSFFTGLMTLLLVLGRDLGAALLFFVTFVIMVYNATKNKILLAFFSLSGIIASIVGYYIFPHVRVRVSAFINPWPYIDDRGYQITQSLFGIGTGGWFGFGLFHGSPKSTPVVESDFIFSGISEEFGLLFGLGLILIYLCTFLFLLYLLESTRDAFHKSVSIGCLSMYALQVFLSIGGSIKFIPSTGVTLPFISAGGSSMISMIIIFSVIQGLYIANQEKGVKPHFRFRLKLSHLSLSVFPLMMLYLCYFQLYSFPNLVNNPYNRRPDLFEERIIRGDILANDGSLLAGTTGNNNKEKRIYPHFKEYSHVIGKAVKGKTGMEALFNSELFSSGLSYKEQLKNRLKGKKTKGDKIFTTLNPKLQTILFEGSEKVRGGGILMEAETGKILALVSLPALPEKVEESPKEGEDVSSKNIITHELYPTTPASELIKKIKSEKLTALFEDSKNFPLPALEVRKTKELELSPLHNLLLLSAIANHGKLMKPYFVSKITTFDEKKTVKSFEPQLLHDLLTKEESKTLLSHFKKGRGGLSEVYYGLTEGETKEKKAYSIFLDFSTKSEKKLALCLITEGKGGTHLMELATKLFRK